MTTQPTEYIFAEASYAIEVPKSMSLTTFNDQLKHKMAQRNFSFQTQVGHNNGVYKSDIPFMLVMLPSNEQYLELSTGELRNVEYFTSSLRLPFELRILDMKNERDGMRKDYIDALCT